MPFVSLLFRINLPSVSKRSHTRALDRLQRGGDETAGGREGTAAELQGQAQTAGGGKQPTTQEPPGARTRGQQGAGPLGLTWQSPSRHPISQLQYPRCCSVLWTCRCSSCGPDLLPGAALMRSYVCSSTKWREPCPPCHV